MSNADTAPVGAMGELGPGKIFKKHANKLWYPANKWRGYPLLADEAPYLTIYTDSLEEENHDHGENDKD